MSGHDRWMPLYVGDYLADTGHLNALQHGAYLLLLMHYWRNGPLPNDPTVLATIARCYDGKTWKAVAGAVLGFFKLGDDGQLHQKRMDRERNRSVEISNVRRAAGSNGSSSKWNGEVRPTTSAGELNTRSRRMANARRLGAHTDDEWFALLDACGRRCVRCGGAENGAVKSIIVKDHITPVYQGGSDAIENLQPLCRTCNSSKGPDRTDFRPPDWQNKMPGKMPGKTTDKAPDTPLANASQNAWLTPTPVPSQSKLDSSREEKEAARESLPPASELTAPTIAAVANALKTKPPPFTPGVVYQLSALTPCRGRPQPQDPVMTPEEQLAELHRMMAEEKVASG